MKHFLLKRTGFVMLFLGFLLCTVYSRAQYTITPFESGNQYTALTKDNSNNVFGVRLNYITNKGEVVKFAAGSTTPTVIYNNLAFEGAGSWIYPWGIAVNSSGDVFVTSANQPVGWQIVKLANTTYAATVIQTGRYFSALAVDAGNNLYAMEYNSATNTYQLVRYAAGAEAGAGTTIYNGFTYHTGATTTYPWGIVFDSQNNIYLLDFWENNGGQLVKLTAPGYAPTVLSTNKSFSALAIDGANNFYTIEGTAPTARVMKYANPAGAGTELYNGLSSAHPTDPWGLAVTSDGKVWAGDAPASPNGRLVQLAPPGVTVSSVNRASTNPSPGTTVDFTVTFSGSVTNVTASSFTLTTTGVTGASITGVTGSGDTYTVTVNTGTGTAGTIRLDVNGSGISPSITNATFTSGQVYTIDRTSPTGSISINGGATYTNNTSVTLTLTGTDANPPLQMAFSIEGGAYSAFEAFATTKTVTLSAGDGNKTVSVQLRDAATNTAFYSDNITLDQTPPNTTFLTTPTDPSTSPSASFTFESSESGSTFQGQLGAGGYVAVTNPWSLTGLSDGPHTLYVRAVDAAGNIDPTPATYTWTIDALPIITSVGVPANAYYKAGDVLSFTVKFTENVTVTGTPQLAVTMGSTTVQVNYTGGTGTNTLTFSYTVQTGDNDADGIQLGTALQLNGGTIKDATNNADLTLNNVANTSGIRVNTSIPTVTLSTTAPTLLNTPFSVTITFSEAVTGLTTGDFSGTNATLSNLSTTDNISYTMLVTPASNGAVTISLPANRATNIGNNGNTASNTLSLTYDNIAPTVSSVTVPVNGYYRVGDVMNFTINFNENIVVNTTGGNPYLPLTIGSTIVNATYTGSTASSASFAYTVVAGNHDMNGITVGNLALNGSTIKDAAGNNADLFMNVGSTTGVRVNTTNPTVTISSNAPTPVTGPFTLTITFSEAVTGFIAADVNITNATIGTLNTTDNITYTVTITPTAGAIAISVPANAAENVGHNGNSASNTLSLVYDTTPPTITSVSVPVIGYYKAGNALNFTVTFDENITVAGGTPSIEVTIGSTTVQATQVSTTPNSITFRYTVVAGNNDMDGITVGTLQLNGSTIRDAANNNANVTLNNVGNTTQVFVNTNVPFVVVGGAISPNAASTVNIVFSEAVTGFDMADIQLTNATASNFQTTDNITYTVLITPAAQGTVSISVPAGAAVNIGGNGNSASAAFTYSYDPNPPVTTAVAVPANGYYKASDVLNFTVNFNETVRVTGAPTLPVIIGSTTVQAAYVSGTNSSALLFSYTVQDGDMDMDGIAFGSNLALNGGAIKDAAGNDANLAINNPGNTLNVLVNTTHATVTLSTTAAARVNAPFTVTVTFSEAVSGLTAGDFTTTNVTVGTPQTTDNITYTVLVTPAADGSVSISLPADAAVNIANNGTKASNTVTVTRDATAPVITAAQNFNILQNSTAGTPIGQVTATDASGIIQGFTITSDPTGGAFAISATGVISVNNMAILNNNVGSTINILVTVSDGLNTSAATAVTIKIDAINKAPILNAINHVVLCATTNSQTIQLTGASAVEPTQTYTLSVASNQALFDVLTVNAAGLITYQLKPGVTSGVATITVTIKDNGGTANGGVDTYQRTFTITVNPLPVVTITSDKGLNVSKGDIVHLTATGGATYNWTATTSSILSGAQAAVAEVRPQANTTYQVTATSSLGCNSTASISISTIEDFKVDATNVLTPNGDGKNDKWVIRNIDSYPDNELKIFDRSGRMVFSQRNYNNNWDGKVNGHPLAEGTYYYFLSISGGAKNAKGFITIILKAN